MASTPRRRPRDPNQLPPGRHGLSREQVVQNQKDRMLEGVTNVTSAMGYIDTSVEDIITAAGLSRRTFYDHFNGKEEVFLAAYDAATTELIGRLEAAISDVDGLAAGMRACLAELLAFLAENPARADLCVVEVMAAGPVAVERRNAAMARLAGMMLAGAQRELPKASRPPELMAETIVGGIYEVIYARVLQGQVAQLPAMLPDLLYSLLLPYLGAEVAEREATGTSKKRTRRA